MANLKRYDVGEGEYGGHEEVECADGTWVRFDDIGELLNTSTNSARDAIADQYEKWLDETCFSVDGHEAVRHFIKWSQQQHP